MSFLCRFIHCGWAFLGVVCFILHIASILVFANAIDQTSVYWHKQSQFRLEQRRVPTLFLLLVFLKCFENIENEKIGKAVWEQKKNWKPSKIIKVTLYIVLLAISAIEEFFTFNRFFLCFPFSVCLAIQLFFSLLSRFAFMATFYWCDNNNTQTGGWHSNCTDDDNGRTGTGYRFQQTIYVARHFNNDQKTS